jgi:flagellar basal-body rod protein FlgB
MYASTPVLIAKALDGLSQRYLAVAENIANANTPGYRPLQVSFEASLKAAAAQGDAAVGAVVPTIDRPTTTTVGDEMRLDLEVANAASTALRYQALLDVLGREMSLRQAVITGGQS